MLPASFEKICCDVLTCPKRNRKREDSGAATSSIEEMHEWVRVDKETQMSSVKASSSDETIIPNKTSEESTEAYFDRNNENISFYLNKFCPSNSSETCPIETQISEAILKWHPSTTSEESQSWLQPQPIANTGYKCTCRKFDLTSSAICSSLTPESFSVKLNLLSNIFRDKIKQNESHYRAQHLRESPKKSVSTSYDELPRPQLLQTHHAAKSFFTYQSKEPWEHLQCFQEQTKNDYLPSRELDSFLEEQFFSCSSIISENDEDVPQVNDRTDQNSVILQLLNEVVHLINKNDVPIQKTIQHMSGVEPSSLHESSSKLTEKEFENKIELNDKPTSTTQLNSLLWPSQSGLVYCPVYLPPCKLPFSLIAFTVDGIQTTNPFECQKADSLKNYLSDNSKSVVTAKQLEDNLSCNPSAECNDKSPCPSLAEIENIKMDASTQADTSLVFHNFPLQNEIQLRFDNLNRQILFGEVDTFKDCCSDQNSVLTAEQLLSHLSSMQRLREDKSTTFSCEPVAGCKNVKACGHSVAENCAPFDYLDNNVERIALPTSLKTEEYVDEELHLRYVDKLFSESFEARSCTPDCLLEYDDEEPVLQKLIDDAANAELQVSELHQSCLDCLLETNDDGRPNYEENNKTFIETRENKNNGIEDIQELSELKLVEYDTIKNVGQVEKLVQPHEKILEPVELIEEQKLQKQSSTEVIELSSTQPTKSTDAFSYEEEKLIAEIEDSSPLNEAKNSSYIAENSSTTDQLIYNLLPEIDRPEVFKQLIAYEHSESEKNYQKDENNFLGEQEYKLSKGKLVESRNRETSDGINSVPGKEMTLTNFQQVGGEGSSAEMKCFIDSLILDFEAMDYARHNSQFDKKSVKPKKRGICARESFPATITDVKDLGANSLYVKWKIHDCFGIGGYEIYTDGSLTNRYYNSRHDAAVITPVDITLPHKIALVAQPYNDDDSLDFIYNISRAKNGLKSLTWKRTEDNNHKKSLALWTPSIFMYDPISGRTNVLMTSSHSQKETVVQT